MCNNAVIPWGGYPRPVFQLGKLRVRRNNGAKLSVVTSVALLVSAITYVCIATLKPRLPDRHRFSRLQSRFHRRHLRAKRR